MNQNFKEIESVKEDAELFLQWCTETGASSLYSRFDALEDPTLTNAPDLNVSLKIEIIKKLQKKLKNL